MSSDDRLVFTCNFKGGTDDTKEIEEAFGSDLVGMSPPLKHGKSLIFRASAVLGHVNSFWLAPVYQRFQFMFFIL